MSLREILFAKRSNIIRQWFDEILSSYPPDTVNFLKSQKDPFSNPVGNTIRQGIEDLFNELIGDSPIFELSPVMDNIIRIRAVQDFTPSQAVFFIFGLKDILRRELKEELKNGLSQEYMDFEKRIDNLALLSFDLFIQCREKIYELKAKEVKDMTFKLLERAKIICGVQE
ncbi:MAG: RsbRD N-terminal domain-containing protein [Thermodesulfovibrionales bacterium]